jgi:hypothetical protein
MKMTVRAGWLALLVFALMGSGGCSGPSIWERAYRGEQRPIADRAVGQPVAAIRDVSWERLMQTREELERERASSDTHPDEWPQERLEQAKSKLLSGLQVREDPASIEVLGRSEFSTTDDLKPESGELGAFAGAIGATRVIYATKLLGKADKIIDEPVTTYTHDYGWYEDRDGRRRREPWSRSSTTWVPIRVQANEHGWIVYFLRDDAGER